MIMALCLVNAARKLVLLGISPIPSGEPPFLAQPVSATGFMIP